MIEWLNSAKAAKNYWRDNRLDEYDFVLLLPHADSTLYVSLLCAFGEKLRSACIADGITKRAIVLSTVHINRSEYYAVKVIAEKTAESMITLYTLYQFTDKLIVGSFTLPPGRKLKNLLDSGIGTEAELVEALFSQMH